MAASVSFHVRAGVSLGSPTYEAHNKTASFGPLNDAGGKSAGFELTWDYSSIHPVQPYAEMTWPIREGRGEAETGYAVTFRFGGDGTHCLVTGGNGAETNPFGCSLSQRSGSKDWDFYVTKSGADRLADASGAIKTDASVSLEEGTFETHSDLRVNGARSVPTNSSTQFDAVLTQEDKLRNDADAASMGFSYKLYDGGRPAYSKSNGQPLHVRGGVSNHRGIVFEGSSFCEIADADNHVVENSGYSCAQNGYYAGAVLTDGRAQYITDFTISKKK